MKRNATSGFFAAALVAAASSGLAPAAQAHTDVQLSIGLPLAPVYVQQRPAPVYVQPQPAYTQPRAVYAPPAVVYERQWRPSYRHEHQYEYQREREQERRRAEWQHREWERRHSGWDGFPPRHGRD